jgi:hypothetical protein
VQLEDRWIDWSNPAFLDRDPAWETFINEQESRYPELRSGLRTVVGGIDKVWVVRRTYGIRVPVGV